MTLDEADQRVLGEFIELDARYGFLRTYALNSPRPLSDDEREALPPLSFEDELLRGLFDVNKGFPEPPMRSTFRVLRALHVLRPPTEAEAVALRRAGLPGGSGRWDVVDEAVFDRVFPGRR